MKRNKDTQDSRKIIATNRRALSKYEILETLEAGIALTGPEVKSLRGGTVHLQDGFVRAVNNEAFLWNVHIPPYSHGSLHVEQDPIRTRKLLLNSKEINRIAGKMTIKGLSVIPLEIYFNRRGIAKVKLAIGKGKRTIDRREDIKRREVDRAMRRTFVEKGKA